MCEESVILPGTTLMPRSFVILLIFTLLILLGYIISYSTNNFPKNSTKPDNEPRILRDRDTVTDTIPLEYSTGKYRAIFPQTQERELFSLEVEDKALGDFRGVYLDLFDLREGNKKKLRLVETGKWELDGLVRNLAAGGLCYATTSQFDVNSEQEFASVNRSLQYSPEMVKIDASLTFKRETTVYKPYSLIELLTIPIDSVKGATVEARKDDDFEHIYFAQIPREFSAELWNARIFFSEIRLIFTDSQMIFRASPKTSLSINHYGGKYIEICVRAKLKSRDKHYDKGDKIDWGFCLEFSRLP